jgi:hypothetical protein
LTLATPSKWTRFASRDAASVDPCIPYGTSISSLLQTLPLGAESRRLLRASETPELDETQASGGARSRPVPLLHP